MLLVVQSFAEVPISQLLPVYAETMQRIAMDKFQNFSDREGAYRAQTQFIDDLKQFFFAPQAVLFILTAQERCVTALRAEEYDHGVLLSCLETDPAARNKGYAKDTVQSSVHYLLEKGNDKIYSHVEKRNAASMAVHIACGFEVIKECATLLDGTVSWNYDTLQYKGTAG